MTLPSPSPSPSPQRAAVQAASRHTTVSVIVPVLHDDAELDRLLRLLRAMAAPPDEIIVVDGAASEACRAAAQRMNCVYVSTRAGRGHQLHAGALRAGGTVLWFLHADATPPPDAVRLVRAAHDSGHVGGYFRFCFTGPPAWHKRLLAALINLRTRVGIAYGDQGIFVSRDAYARSGGFADVALFEEVPLMRQLRRDGKLARLAASVGVSPRRWERDGWIRRTLCNRALALAYLAGVPADRLARHYRAPPESRSGPLARGAAE
jgi:rSAM/selenodomain-associated transferase 2